jgi:hypothetical protein
MRFVVTIFAMVVCAIAAASDSVQAQPGKGVTIAITNNTKGNVIVKGYTVVGGVQRQGQLLTMRKGGTAFEAAVPAGIRYYTVFDALNPARALLRDFPVPVQNRDLPLQILQSPTDPTRIIIAPLMP